MSCSLCQIRKEKRFCLALHGRICAPCCGEQREVTIACPSECEYLRQARQHERPRSFEEIAAAEQFPTVDVPKSVMYRLEPVITGVTFTLAGCLRKHRDLHDQDLIEALTAAARRYETLSRSGLILAESTLHPLHQEFGAALDKMVADYRQFEAERKGTATLTDGEVLQCVVFMIRVAQMRTNGRAKGRPFAEFVLSQFPTPPAVSPLS